MISPVIDPIVFSIGPIAIRWYALAYLAGLVGGAWYAGRLFSTSSHWPNQSSPFPADKIWDLMGVIALGVLVGGRLGYATFYAPFWFMEHPLEILAVWKGGMSFHGGCIGAGIAAWIYTRICKGSVPGVADALACAAPIGLGLGRIANFVNGELWGRPSNLPWAMIFPDPLAGGIARHPSQLYEATLEGGVLFLLIYVIVRYYQGLRYPGFCTGLFLAGYAVFRIGAEFFREPDPGLGILFFISHIQITMGILLSAPMLVIGIAMIAHSRLLTCKTS